MKNNLKKLSVAIKNKINLIDNEITQRKRKVAFKDILFQMCLYNSDNNKSNASALSDLKIKTTINVSKTAILKKRKNITPLILQKLNNLMLDLIYTNNLPRFIAVDGSTLNVSKKLALEGFKMNDNRTYCHVHISSLYDVNNDVLINLNMSEKLDEREQLIRQLEFVKRGDTLIMDRGYFSWNLLKILHLRGINYLFRSKENLNALRFTEEEEIINKTAVYEDNTRIGINTIKFKVEESTFYMITSLLRYTLEDIKILYHKRWDVESNFRDLKHNLSLVELKSKSKLNIHQDILIHNFLFLLNSYLYNHLNMQTKNNYKINRKNCLKIVINDILFYLLYLKHTKKNINELLRICKIIQEDIILIQLNRHFIRKRIKPDSKWYRPRGIRVVIENND
jgi:hypothetical protein